MTEHKLPDLPYEFNALEPYVDEQTMRIHHGKHHAAYVNNLNNVLKDHPNLQNKSLEDLLKDINSVPESIRTVVRNNGGGHANHSLFWTVMKSKGDGEPKGDLADAIKKKFGDFESFQKKFSETAMGRFGSGWAWLVVNNGELEVYSTANQDSPLMEGKTPILGLDVWEHAYYLKYQNRRVEYVENWWNVVNWEQVKKNFTNAGKR